MSLSNIWNIECCLYLSYLIELKTKLNENISLRCISIDGLVSNNKLCFKFPDNFFFVSSAHDMFYAHMQFPIQT